MGSRYSVALLVPAAKANSSTVYWRRSRVHFTISAIARDTASVCSGGSGCPPFAARAATTDGVGGGAAPSPSGRAGAACPAHSPAGPGAGRLSFFVQSRDNPEERE